MSKFKELINSLKAYTVVIIENEFTLIDDPIKLLGFYCLCNQNILDRINEDLLEKKFDEIKQLLEELRIAFQQLEQNDELIKQIPALDNFEHYLEKINGTQILNDFNLEKFKRTVENDLDYFIKNIFLKYGALNTYPENQYGEIFKEIKEITNTEILFFNQTPTVGEQDSFIKSIKESVSLTNSNFYLCLIDKSLGNGEDSAGKDFALKDLTEINQQHQLNSVCFIYTSRPTNDNNPPSELKHYYAQEIGKSSPPNFEEITKILAQSAYATVFDNICNNFHDSAGLTLETVLKNQKNIKYIVDKSHEEGITPYDSIKYWYNLLLQKYFEQKEIDNYSYVAALSSFFKNEFLEDHPKMAEIDEEIRDLNSYELYDNNINFKHLPISPGDIFEIKDEYYILIGQLCDTLIRGKKLKRNYITGELLKIKIIDEVLEEKYVIDMNNKVKKIKISNFNFNGVLKTLEIEISTNNANLIEFEVLDLCCLNQDGSCIIDIHNEIDETIIRLLPDYSNDYYNRLKQYYRQRKINQIQMLLKEISIHNPLLMSKIDFKRNGNLIQYEIRRISRLKGRYYDSLYNNILNNKGRIDLNLIDNSNEKVTSNKLIFSLPNTVNHNVIIDNFNLCTSKGKVYIKKEELIQALPQYSELIRLCNDDELIIENKSQYEMRINENVIELQFKYHLEEKKSHGKNKFSYKDLFNKQKPTDDDKFEHLETNIIGNINNEEGNATTTLSDIELEKGVYFFEEKITIKLINGIIKKELDAK
jgi:hypothetical protein